jgi:WhiB family transcriptional regulator, redox-sensing transcriptional regulator
MTETWMARANCRGEDPALFFPIGPSESRKSMKKAAKICFQCDVFFECEQYALNDPDIQGIWAATNPGHRKELRLTAELERVRRYSAPSALEKRIEGMGV